MLTIEDYFDNLAEDVKQIKADVAEIKKNKQEDLLNTWLTHEDVCALLKISIRSLYNYRSKGLIPFSHAEGTGIVYYKLEDVHKFLEDNYTSIQKQNA